MFNRLIIKLTFAVFLVMTGSLQPAIAQTPEPLGEEFPCADEALSRYKAWVKALPFRPVLPT